MLKLPCMSIISLLVKISRDIELLTFREDTLQSTFGRFPRRLNFKLFDRLKQDTVKLGFIAQQDFFFHF